MPSTLTYPGVYVEEIPSGVRTLTGVATSVTAFMGRAQRGPVGKPVLVSSPSDFDRLFGGLWLESPMSYAVRDFFRNGGSQAVIVRLYHAQTVSGASVAGAAKLTFDSLQLEAVNPGAWGSKLSGAISLPDATSDLTKDIATRLGLVPADLFNLRITYSSASGTSEEFFSHVTYKNSVNRIDRVLEQSSKFVRVSAGTLPAADAVLPAASTTPVNAQAGSALDSAALVEADYVMTALDDADQLNLLCIPPDVSGENTPTGVYAAALTYCAKRRAILLVDPPKQWKGKAASEIKISELGLGGSAARNAAVYYPRVLQQNPLRGGQLEEYVPCGIVAGVISRTDVQRGVWKAPAGLDAAITGVDALSVKLTDDDNGQLNPQGINCLRAFPVTGQVLWGARTLRGADQLGDEYKYLSVRRLALFIEESLSRGTRWVVHEPNDEPLWSQIRLNVGAFMQTLFRQGAFAGQSPREAYFVKCDKESTTATDVNSGVVNIIVGFAPLKPAEFVVIKFQQMSGSSAA